MSIFAKLFNRKDKLRKSKRLYPEEFQRRSLLDDIADDELPKRTKPKIAKLDKADIKLRQMVRKALQK